MSETHGEVLNGKEIGVITPHVGLKKQKNKLI